ncbi:MAG: hypothetical protein J7L71_12020 [Spirochaetaceae bacterium]|nr:hypothetical protein [Spirochaetaceae bacterium]
MITAEKKEEWLLHLELWKESGLSANRYCIENNINKNSFRYWIDRDRGKIKVKKSFVKLNVQKPLSVTCNNSISLKYGSYEIQIPTAFNNRDLESLLAVLESRIKCS